MKRKIEIIHNSIKGDKRKYNKDGLLLVNTEEYIILGVFDGVSSAKDSYYGVYDSIEYIKNNYSNYVEDGSFMLSKIMYDNNRELLKKKYSEPYATYCILVIPKKVNKDIILSSLGDSRIYSISRQYFDRITNDDNDNFKSNIIYKCLGMKEYTIETFNDKKIISKENQFVLCSDGFYNLMENNLKRFHNIFNFKRMGNISKSINMEITGNNNDDDSSYIFVRISDV